MPCPDTRMVRYRTGEHICPNEAVELHRVLGELYTGIRTRMRVLDSIQSTFELTEMEMRRAAEGDYP